MDVVVAFGRSSVMDVGVALGLSSVMDVVIALGGSSIIDAVWQCVQNWSCTMDVVWQSVFRVYWPTVFSCFVFAIRVSVFFVFVCFWLVVFVISLHTGNSRTYISVVCFNQKLVIIVILRILLSLVLLMMEMSVKCLIFSCQKILDSVPWYL